MATDNQVPMPLIVVLVGVMCVIGLLLYSIVFNKRPIVVQPKEDINIINKEAFTPVLNYLQKGIMYINAILYYNQLIGETGVYDFQYSKYDVGYTGYIKGISGNTSGFIGNSGSASYYIDQKNYLDELQRKFNSGNTSTTLIYYTDELKKINTGFKKWLDKNNYKYEVTKESSDIKTILSTLKDSAGNNIIVNIEGNQYFVNKDYESLTYKEYYDRDDNTVLEIYNIDNLLICIIYFFDDLTFLNDYSDIVGTFKVEWVCNKYYCPPDNKGVTGNK